MKKSVITATLQAAHDANITATPSSRDHGIMRARYNAGKKHGNAARIAAGMQHLRVKDAALLAEKQRLVAAALAASNDVFDPVNLCPILNGSDPERISRDQRHLEAAQRLVGLFSL